MPNTELAQQQGIYAVANLFDQFDAPEGTPVTNPYDHFDGPAAPAVEVAPLRAPEDLQIREYNPTIRDKTRDLLRPLSDLITNLSTVPRNMPQIPRIPQGAMSAFGQPGEVAQGLINTGTGLLNQTPTPVGLALLAGGIPAKIAGAVLSPVMAQNAADQFQPTLNTIADPKTSLSQKVEAGAGEALTALGAAAPLMGLRRGPLQEPAPIDFEGMKNVTPPKPLALPDALTARIAEKTPIQAAMAIREAAKLEENPAKKATLVDAADRLDRQIAMQEAQAEQGQRALDAHDLQIQNLEDQQKAIQDQQKAQQKAADDAQKLALAQAKAQGEQVQAIMEANTPPPQLQAQKPQVLANSAAVSAKAIENNPENAQAQLNAITGTQAPQPQTPPQNALQIQGANAQVLRQPEAQPQNPLALPGMGNGNAQPQVPAGAGAQEVTPLGPIAPFAQMSAPVRLRQWLASPNKGAFAPDKNGMIPKKSAPSLLKRLGVSDAEVEMYLKLGALGAYNTGPKVSIDSMIKRMEARVSGLAIEKLINTRTDEPPVGANEFERLQHRLETEGFNIREFGPAQNLGDHEVQLTDPAGNDWYPNDDGSFTIIEDQGDMQPEKHTKVPQSQVPPEIVDFFRLREIHGTGARHLDEAKYEFIAPKKNMKDYTEILTKLPGTTGEAWSGPHFGGRDINVVGHTRVFTDKLPTGEKVVHVIEVQGDHAQQMAEREANYKKAIASGAKEGKFIKHPTLDVYEKVALQAAIQHAREIGAKYVFLPDAETAMMSEGHDRFVKNGEPKLIETFQRPPVSQSGGVDENELFIKIVRKVSKLNESKDGYSYHIASGRNSNEWGIYKAKQGVVTQEPGMRAAYDQRLPRIMEKLVGDKGKPVDMGEHKANEATIGFDPVAPDMEGGGSPVFKDKNGKPKTRITGRVYDITGAPEKFSAFNYGTPETELAKPAAPAEFVGVQEGIPGNAKFPDMELYNLTKDIPGHNAGSTVTRETLEKAGFKVPKQEKKPEQGPSSERGGIGADTMATAAGAAGGGLYGFASTHKRDDESEEEFQTRRLLRAAMFAVGGGFAGGGLVRLLEKSKPSNLLTKIENEAKGVDSMPEWYQKLRQTGPMVKFREAINNSRAIVKDMVGNAHQEGVPFDDRANPYLAGKLYAARVSEAQRKAKDVMDKLQAGVVQAGKASGIGVDNFINRFNLWMEARHTPDYNNHLAQLHLAAGGQGPAPVGRLTNQEAAQILVDAKKDGLEPVFSNLRDGYRSVVESIRDLLSKDLITPQTRQEWVRRFPEYMPLNRVLDESDDSAIIGHIGGGPGLSVLGSGVRKIKGSELDVSDIAGNLMANWNDAITRVEKNEVAKAAGYFFKNLDFNGTPYPGIEVRSPKVIGSSGNAPIHEQYRPENMISYMVKGKPQWIVFRDPKIATAFSNLNPESQNSLMRFIATPTRLLSRAFTGYNLDFSIPNILRDRQSAAWKAISQGDISGALQQINPVKVGSDPAVVSQWIAGKQTPETQLFQQMMDNGGMPGGYASSTRQKAQDFVEELRRADTNPASWTIQKTKAAFNFLSEISEGSTRFRAYKRAKDLGATDKQAALQALNSSIDFNQKGTWSQMLGAFFAFFNPSAQGGVNAAKNLLRSKDAAAVLLAGLVGIGAAVDHWNKGFDPDWKRRKAFAYARTNGIPLIYGVDPQTKEFKYFSIPISQELRPVKAVVDFANEITNGEIKTGDNLMDELGRVGGAISSAANPLGASPIDHPLTTITPTMVRPLVDIATNRDYADRPIVPDRLHDSNLVQRQAQRNLNTYDARTGRMAIALSDLLKKDFNLEVSPEHMKYLVNSYGGGPARLTSSVINSAKPEATGFKASDLPVVGSFVRRAQADNLERNSPLYKQTQEQLSDAKTSDELASQKSKLFFKHTFDQVEPKDWPKLWQALNQQGLIPKDPVFIKQILTDLTDKIKGRGDVDKLVAQFSTDNGERAVYYAARQKDFKNPAEYTAYLQDQAKKGLITPPMIKQLNQLLKK